MATDDPTRRLLDWLSALDPPSLALLGCAHADLPPIPPDAVGIRAAGCLVDAGISLPAQILAGGVPAIEVIECPQRPAASQRQLREWGELLVGIGPATVRPRPGFRQRRGPVFDLGSPGLSRRAVFGLPTGRHATLDPADDDAARAIAALRLLHDQGRTRSAPVAEPAAAPASPPPADADHPAVSLVAGACTACGVCVKACPHGALELLTTGSATVLRHHVDACRADLSCVQLCPPGVLGVAGRLPLIDLARTTVTELATVATARCQRCGALHPAAEGTLCAVCSARAADVFGSFTPPGRPVLPR
jgi:ferredoxin